MLCCRADKNEYLQEEAEDCRREQLVLIDADKGRCAEASRQGFLAINVGGGTFAFNSLKPIIEEGGTINFGGKSSPRTLFKVPRPKMSLSKTKKRFLQSVKRLKGSS